MCYLFFYFPKSDYRVCTSASTHASRICSLREHTCNACIHALHAMVPPFGRQHACNARIRAFASMHALRACTPCTCLHVQCPKNKQICRKNTDEGGILKANLFICRANVRKKKKYKRTKTNRLRHKNISTSNIKNIKNIKVK